MNKNDGAHASSRLLIGIGNELRGDDAIGLWVAQQLAEKQIPRLVIKTLQSEPTQLLDVWEAFECVYIVDAISAKKQPGACVLLTTEEISEFRKQCTPTSHLLGVFDAIELARSIGRLPAHLFFYGIQVKAVTLGNGISQEVLAGGEKVVDILLHKLS